MRIILTGATGFAGGEVLRQVLLDPAISSITSLVRRPSGIPHAKLTEIILPNFLDYSVVDFAGHDACIWALGVSQTAVDEAAYIEITYDYMMAGAHAMLAANPDLRFCFLSGRGADQNEQARTLFGRIKGRTEKHLAELTPRAVSFRPAYIKPTKASGPRKDFARFLAPIGSLMALVSDTLAVDCDQLAHVMIDVAKHGSPEPVLDNMQIRNWSIRNEKTGQA